MPRRRRLLLPNEPEILESTFPVTAPDYHVDIAVASFDASDQPTLVALVEVQLA